MATVFVSPFGDDILGDGTLESPFGTINKGISKLTGAGDVLFLRGGTYNQNVTVSGKAGSADAPIVIRAYGREPVSIDGAEPIDANGRVSRFRLGGNEEWEPATGPGAHEDEYVSCYPFPLGSDRMVRHGAFMDREPYTRLITYSRLEDLRATQQKFGRLPLADPIEPLPGLPVLENGEIAHLKLPGGGEGPPYKRPWVYMGPGLFFDGNGHIHIRLSHTTNNLPGIVDYDGGTDPRQLRLAISRPGPAPLVVENCKFVTFDHVTIRYGTSPTIRVAGSEDVVFDHVRVFAGRFGIRLGHNNHRLVFRHCEVLGGIPTWMFRSDLKDVYSAQDGDEVIENRLGHGTSETLLLGEKTNEDTLIHHCEFVDGHDLAMFGRGTRFHHNWVHNFNDDALIVDLADTEDLEVSQNVVMRCIEALSFARDKPQNIGGTRRVHRNLIDLRGPTSSIRPRPDHHLVEPDDANKDGSVFRFGQLYKPGTPDGPLDLFHNTVLVAHQVGLAGIQHYSSAQPDDETRRSVNNIFVDVTPSADRPKDYASAFLPGPDFHGPTDANCYHQITEEPIPLLRHRGYKLGPGHDHDPEAYATLDAYNGPGHDPDGHFEHSKATFPPGFEHSGIDDDPGFLTIAADGVPQFDDDLRIRDGSPAKGRGRILADADIDIDDPLAGAGPPDLGCYEVDHAGLEVGVDGRRRFPELP